MSIIVTSTAGTAADVNAAAEMYEGDELVQAAEPTPADRRGDDNQQGHEAAIARTENVAGYDSGKTAEETERETQSVQEAIDEDKEDRKEEYLDEHRPGKTRAKLLRRLSRQHAENEELRARLAQYESGQPPAQPQNGDGQPARTQQAEPQPRPQPQFSPQQADQQEFIRQFQAAQAALPPSLALSRPAPSWPAAACGRGPPARAR